MVRMHGCGQQLFFRKEKFLESKETKNVFRSRE